MRVFFFKMAVITVLLFGLVNSSRANRHSGKQLRSPDGKVRVEVYLDDANHLAMRMDRGDASILHPSPLGMVVDGVDLGAGAKVESAEKYTINESYPWNGAHSKARNYCRGTVYSLRTGDFNWKLNVRAYNDGVAFNYSLESGEEILFNGESTVLNFDDGLDAKFMRQGYGEESRVYTKPIGELKGKAHGRTMPPLLFYPPDMSSFIMVLEGGGLDFHGYSLVPREAASSGTYAFDVAYAEKPQGWQIKGPFDTGWKIISTVDTLNELVNTDLVPNVCPNPDPQLFPQGANTDWIKPGTSTWNWWARISKKYQKQLELVDLAAEIGADYHLVDIGWDSKWGGGAPESYEYLRKLCDYGAKKGVGILVWKCSDTSLNLRRKPESNKFKALRDLAVKAAKDEMDAELKRIAEAGAKGIKLDYINSENSQWKGYMEDFLRVAAKNHLLVDFHGCPIPAGESRTYPNQLTREAIYGGEKLRGGGGAKKKPTSQYIDLLFTRLIAGPADYTPAIFSHPQGEGFTHAMQLASAAMFTSPLTVWADNPTQYLASAGIELIRDLPTTWDETIVLPGTELEKVAVFARRKGQEWYIAGINGWADKQQVYNLNLDFVESDKYEVFMCHDNIKSGSYEIEAQEGILKKGASLKMAMLPSGGFIMRLRPLNSPEPGSAEETAQGKKWVCTPDPKLPNVLLLGDSISIGYTLETRALLDGLANVYRPVDERADRPENCGHTGSMLNRYDELLEGPEWDLIHFNSGLHDLKRINRQEGETGDADTPPVFSLEEYRRQLEEIVRRLEKTGARLIFATTTPFPSGVTPCRLPEDAVKYNRVALEVMAKHEIPIDDLYSYTLPHLGKWQRDKNVHFLPYGRQKMAVSVADSIRKELKEKARR